MNDLVVVDVATTPVTPIVVDVTPSVENTTENTTPETTPVVRNVSRKRGRGRPQVYFGLTRLYIIGLIAVLGLTKTQKILNNGGAVRKSLEKKYGVTVNTNLIPKRLNISMLKLHQLGREGGVELHRGRPSIKKVG